MSGMFTINSNGFAFITMTVLMVMACIPIASGIWLLYRVWTLMP